MNEFTAPPEPDQAPRRRDFTDLISKPDWVVVGWLFSIKLALIIFGAKSFQIFQNERVVGIYRALTIWNRWDSLHYLGLAELGYGRPSSTKTWFYPLFPWIVRFFTYITGDYLISGFIVSAIAGVAAVLVFRRLVELDYSRAVALRSVWFFLIFPTAHFFHIAYTEALFLAFTLASIYAARVNRWPIAGVLGALAFATRANGIVLIPTLGVEALHQFWLYRKWNWKWLWIGLIPLGFSVYLLVNWKVTGDPFWFLKAREKLFAMHFAWPWVGIREAILNFGRSPSDAETVGAQELYFTILALICTIASWIKLRPVYAMWMTGNYLLVTCISFLESVPRYALTLFPIFILFSLLAANRVWRGFLTVMSILFLALFASLFVRGWWIF